MAKQTIISIFAILTITESTADKVVIARATELVSMLSTSTQFVVATFAELHHAILKIVITIAAGLDIEAVRVIGTRKTVTNQHIIAIITVLKINTIATKQFVIAVATVLNIFAVAATQVIVTRSAKLVIRRLAGPAFDFTFANRQSTSWRQQTIITFATEQIVTLTIVTSVQLVIAGQTENDVATSAAVDHIVKRRAENQLISLVASELQRLLRNFNRRWQFKSSNNFQRNSFAIDKNTINTFSFNAQLEIIDWHTNQSCTRCTTPQRAQTIIIKRNDWILTANVHVVTCWQQIFNRILRTRNINFHSIIISWNSVRKHWKTIVCSAFQFRQQRFAIVKSIVI
mmetsp:Transcript_5076/g.8249  ORF Transcript_5076/g.8249 Transcript_5076/m.8249 type:complete len:343 (-) Transcript_5076:315-1343(-)